MRDCDSGGRAGDVRPAPGPRARGRNQAREPRRRVTRAGAHVTRETGPRRTGGRAAAGTERHGREPRRAGLRKRRPGGRRAPRTRPSRARAQSGARTAPPRNARGQAHARYARNRAAPQRGNGRRRGGNDTGWSRGRRDCDSGGRAGGVRPAPGPRMRGRNRAREPRRRVTRAGGRTHVTRETGPRRSQGAGGGEDGTTPDGAATCGIPAAGTGRERQSPSCLDRKRDMLASHTEHDMP